MSPGGYSSMISLLWPEKSPVEANSNPDSILFCRLKPSHSDRFLKSTSKWQLQFLNLNSLFIIEGCFTDYWEVKGNSFCFAGFSKSADNFKK